MLNPKEPVVVRLQTSCTEEEAVEKLLGWRQGPIRRQHTLITKHGVPEEMLQYSHSLGGSLEQQLEDIYEKAQIDWIKSVNAKASIKVRQKLKSVVAQKNELIVQAEKYKQAIEEELNKGEDSILKVHKKATADSGITHITLKSLDRWAQQKYGKSVLNPTASKLMEEKVGGPVVSPEYNEVTPKGGMSKTLADNLLTSFAFLVEALAESASGYRGDKGPIVSAIATRVNELAKKANGNEELGGQSVEAIQDRVEAAMAVKCSKLPRKQPL